MSALPRKIALMRRLDATGAVRFVDVSRLDAEACPLDRRAMLARFHASEDGKLLSGAAACAAMSRVVPLLPAVGLLARSPAVLRALEAAYMRLLRTRPAFQRAIRQVASS